LIAGAEAAFDSGFRVARVGLVVDFLVGAFSVVPCGEGFPVVIFASDFGAADRCAAGLVVLTGSVAGFAGFFIAFAMDQLTKGCSVCALAKDIGAEFFSRSVPGLPVRRTVLVFCPSPCRAAPDNCSKALNQKLSRITYDIVRTPQNATRNVH
jgi:hypothetical protein